MFGPGNVPTITAAELEAKRAEGWMLLDVRNDDEWADGRIEGSTHIPLHEVVARLDEIGDRVVCICAVGGRSAQATAYLLTQDREAVNLAGGVQTWSWNNPLTRD